jgi:quercetin dioxygenase-like cupin family protein
MGVLLSGDLTVRDKIWLLEDEVKKMPQCHIGIRHFFADGVYAREMSAPAGAVVTGKIHKYSQINILSSGRMTVLLGEGAEEISAPFTLVAPAGSKRAFYCHTDCVWTTILGTDEKDPNKIEEEFTTNDEREYLDFQMKSIGQT